MAKHPRMVQYLDKVQGLLKEFPTFTIQQVPWAENTHADALISPKLRRSNRKPQDITCKTTSSLADHTPALISLEKNTLKHLRSSAKFTTASVTTTLRAVTHPEGSKQQSVTFHAIGHDFGGPMPTAPAKKEMMIVATNYFTKWIEAEALSFTKEADME
ncbi:hypothetical protein L3X38_003562 [Prunus dulcis]|uniref:RNase H type-1 domain-containing protein n=1 Tax=Prunus dulcis TaxID=3755 RepID=A0AAD5F235_PRUDU|nr:hypothetical protein L3X38_003562 [Prunus dulcis]